jgi:hypothetical protein
VRRSVALAPLVAVALAGCEGRDYTPSRDRDAEPAILVGDDGGLPPGCRPRELAERLTSLFSEDDRGHLRRLLARGRAFQWYSETSGAAGPGHVALNEPEAAVGHLVGRRAAGERVTVLMASASDAPHDPGAAAVSFLATREGPDLRRHSAGRAWVAGGKAELVCAEGRFFVLSIATYRPFAAAAPLHVALPCPRPARWAPGSGAAVVCARAAAKDWAPERAVLRVRPPRGHRRTVFRASIRGTYPLTSGDNYHFLLGGPGGPECRDRLGWQLGYFPDDDGIVRARLFPTRRGSGVSRRPITWCPGRYRLRVEFRDFARQERLTRRPIARRSFVVR